MGKQRDLFDTQMDLMDQLHHERSKLWHTNPTHKGASIKPDAPGHPGCAFKVFVDGIKVAELSPAAVMAAVKQHIEASI